MAKHAMTKLARRFYVSLIRQWNNTNGKPSSNDKRLLFFGAQLVELGYRIGLEARQERNLELSAEE